MMYYIHDGIRDYHTLLVQADLLIIKLSPLSLSWASFQSPHLTENTCHEKPDFYTTTMIIVYLL